MSQTAKLINLLEQEDIDFYCLPLNGRNKGLYGNGVIAVSDRIETEHELSCIIAEELGHHYTTCGNILDQSNLSNQKQEKKARRWAYDRLVPLDMLIECFYARCSGSHEIAEHLEVTEELLEEALKYYHEKYGVCVVHNDHFIYFDPLGIMRLF